ncbi:3-hydroxybutyryl-CoA dehydrogenase [Sulfolobus sp. A20]|uniref:3-hydroxyacyl-CoA dehydrogenase n=1 Tax=Saccharolobus sp. A20 TaxID=1891280 RepID=UPI000845E84C|nr:3-hydroxyacyl-CoA dehydrogenase [Sulfolobus sp. A20]TRM74561.1 3-hydroxybutyryl-CoA dehydrogenase [Sulfolobus sp. B5]TRM80998.1 3-hydroxybutyryl-CoA dehydrogenase [Sulfolobus sp. A20-N-F6]TRM81779.1 3-hydroxybutyryl-CoA dehydrogenase [Sulfolobus sp. D5]TRM83563.1 3-hydroxybutyryl-CoA dehydrogenase [Sulfolobus sp. F3]TRM86286.1 3-hydroxybutyryl-CoA dehydrogenase [Sulfolobus sp. C3]TRM91911.1 3-hydroxybutyryl-CoA dehydrogenase [Sulfolobus sp. A20-N-G8]TRM98117.1 3-hydroxybutyryl-CoA dehydro
MVNKVAVIGSGTMGHGIAEIVAISGYQVYLSDVSSEILDSAIKKIKWSLEKLHEKGQIKESVDNVLSRIKTVVGLTEEINDADMAIEAVPERIDLKKQVFLKLEELLPKDAILATNTSSLPITEISEGLRNKGRIIGTHFFNPPVIMQLVEIIRGNYTTDEVVKETRNFIIKLNKKPIMVNKDVPGFVVNRILLRIITTCCMLVEKGITDYKTIDATARYKLGFPMGVFELVDYTGVDVNYYVSSAMIERGFKAYYCKTLEEMTKRNELGVKSGKGFYEYPSKKYVKVSLPEELGSKLDPLYIISPAINEAYWMVRNGVASEEDIDIGVKLGLNFPKGITDYLKEMGRDKVIKALDYLYRISGGREEYSPSF